MVTVVGIYGGTNKRRKEEEKKTRNNYFFWGREAPQSLVCDACQAITKELWLQPDGRWVCKRCRYARHTTNVAA